MNLRIALLLASVVTCAFIYFSFNAREPWSKSFGASVGPEANHSAELSKSQTKATEKRGAALRDGSIVTNHLQRAPKKGIAIVDDYLQSPDHIVGLLKQSYVEYIRDLREFYRYDLSLSPAQMQALDDLQRGNSVAEGDLPIEAGIEVVTSKTFGGKNHSAYLNQAQKIMGNENFARLQIFLKSWPKNFASHDAYIGELFNCCMELSAR